jgi:hypothetical protein
MAHDLTNARTGLCKAEIEAQFVSFNFTNPLICGVVSSVATAGFWRALASAHQTHEPCIDADDGFRKKGLNPSYEATNTGAAPSHGAPSIASVMLSTRKPPAEMPARSGAREEAMACSG